MSRPEPRMPSHVRLARPDCWRAGATGRLHPDERDCYLGLATLADDAGWLLWRPAEIGASLYGYQPVGRRERDLARRARALEDAGLLVLNECGCALLPRMDDLASKGGRPTYPVREYHLAAHASTYAHVHAPQVKGSEGQASEGKEAAGQRDEAAPAANGEDRRTVANLAETGLLLPPPGHPREQSYRQGGGR